MEHSYFPVKCQDIISAGVTATGALTYKTALDEANKDPKFSIFADTCAKKGYFNGVEEGSLEYLQRNAKLIKKFREKSAAGNPTAAAGAPTAGKLDADAAAEEKKTAGNEAIKNKDYELAVQRYSEALQLSASGPNAHIYYANRAAAYCHLSDYKQAIKDCEASIRKCPTYTKAHSRLGLAHFFLKNYAAAAAAYEKAAELEPSNKAHKDSAFQARQKLEEEEAAISVGPAARTPAGGMPDLASMMSQLGGGAGGGGFMAMAQQMMQNPAMMAQAQQMMQNPAMMAQAQQMMQNPDAMRQAMSALGMSGEGGGGPDMAQMQQMLGNPGGGAGASGIPDFSGFQNN